MIDINIPSRMACRTVVVESVKIAAGSHLQDCTESCLSPSLGWLSPTRISFSKDFAAQPEGSDSNNIIKATDNLHKGKERTGDRDSMSEFEFAMSMLESENANGKHMLAADELFFKGKLLPLYIPQYIEGSEQQQLGQCARLDSDQLEQISARKSSDQKVPTKRSSSSAARVNGAVTPTPKSKELILPTSPKTPRCSSKLRELFGLKKAVKPYSSTAASQEGAAATVLSCLSSRSSSSKQKAAAKLQEKPPLTLSRAKRLFCRSDDGSKVLEARNSTSEPLLAACTLGDDMQLGCPVISFQPHHQAHHQQYKKSQMINVANSSLCGNACNLARIQRSNRVSDHVEEGPSIRSSQQQQQLQQLMRAKARNNENARSSASRRMINEDKPCGGLGGSGNGIMRRLRRPLMQGESGETSPARRSSGAMSPAGSSGHWSPGRHSAGALMSGWGSPGRHSGASYSPGRLSLGEPISCMDAGHGRLMRARSLERSSSYSPKSLQRKYDQLKAMRQREGWRSLERSSSYNNNMNSVRVAPVLNIVPVVCIRSKSSGSNGGGGGGGGGGFGLGHLLFSTKSNNNNGRNSTKLDHCRAPSAKLQQPKVLLSRRPPPITTKM